MSSKVELVYMVQHNIHLDAKGLLISEILQLPTNAVRHVSAYRSSTNTQHSTIYIATTQRLDMDA